MAGGYTREERRALAEALERGAPLVCPACGTPLARSEIEPRPELPYVRRRAWLVCPGCKRSTTLERGRPDPGQR